jgi:hypothetical protein
VSGETIAKESRVTDTLHRLFGLSGRVAVITDASRGIGLQMAEAPAGPSPSMAA